MSAAETIDDIIGGLHASLGLRHKQDIASVVARLGIGGDSVIAVGDDCAAIPDPSGNGYLLLAIEGFQSGFVSQDPWFAGWCGIMVNLSDIAAMGGRPLAVVDALWSRGGEDSDQMIAGLRAASAIYQVPVVGGHSNLRHTSEQLAVAVLGRAQRLLTSFDAQAGDVLVLAIDLRGEYRAPFLNWNCATGTPPERLRADLELLPQLAESGLCRAAKDISQAGILGTTMMLLECSGVGADIDLAAIPRPHDVDDRHWLLSTFPSFGFVLAVSADCVDVVLRRFSERDIACAAIGHCTSQPELRLCDGDTSRVAWRFDEAAVTGCAPQAASHTPHNPRNDHA